MATILITGGTGMIGTAVTGELVQKGHQVIILSRSKNQGSNQKNISYAFWNPSAGAIDENAIKKADAIIHLAGANVAGGRWTESRKKEIVDSRVKSGALLIKALTQVPNHVQVVVSASAIGYYGGDEKRNSAKPFVETDPADYSFLGQTSQQWEAAITPVKE